MHKSLIVGLTAVIAVVTLPLFVFAWSGPGEPLLLAKLDAEEALELKQSGRIISLDVLIARVHKDYPGQIIEIELDEDNDRYIYDIEVVGEEGVVIELKIDAATGEVLEFKKDY